jgi:hypothetical protein
MGRAAYLHHLMTSGKVMEISLVYPNILKKVAGNADAWNFDVAHWRYEKGTVELDRPWFDKRVHLQLFTWTVVHKFLRGEERHHLSVDLQWGDRQKISKTKEAWDLYHHLCHRKDDIEKEIKSNGNVSGIFRVRDDAPCAKWMMEAGFVLEHIDLNNASRYDEYAKWLADAIPVVRKVLLLEVARYSQLRKTI